MPSGLPRGGTLSVAATGRFVSLRRFLGHMRLWQFEVSVVGDASGGTATLTIPFPRDRSSMFKALDLFMRGEASAVHRMDLSGYYVATPESSWQTRSLSLQPDASERLTNALSVDVVNMLPFYFLHPGNESAGGSSVILQATNVENTLFGLAMTWGEYLVDEWSPRRYFPAEA